MSADSVLAMFDVIFIVESGFLRSYSLRWCGRLTEEPSNNVGLKDRVTSVFVFEVKRPTRTKSFWIDDDGERDLFLTGGSVWPSFRRTPWRLIRFEFGGTAESQ